MYLRISRNDYVSEPLNAHHNLHFYGKFVALKILINNLRKSQLILYMERLLLFRVLYDAAI